MLRMMVLALLIVWPALHAGNGNPAEVVAEILPHDAYQRQQQGAILVDVREDDERAQGMAVAALGVPMGTLGAAPVAYLPDQDAEILLICRSGRRSKQVAAQLLQQGYTRVFSVHGGTLRWQEDGLPMTRP